MTRRSSARRASAAIQDALYDASDADDGGSESELVARSSKSPARSQKKKKPVGRNTNNKEEERENGQHHSAIPTSPFADMDSKPRLSPTKTYSSYTLKRKRREALANGDALSLTDDDSETSYLGPKKATSASASPVRKTTTGVKKVGGGSRSSGKEVKLKAAPVKGKPKPKPPTLHGMLDLSGLGPDDESDLTPLSSSTESEPELEATPEPPPAVVVTKAKTTNRKHSPPRGQIRRHPMFATPPISSATDSTSNPTVANGKRPKSSWEASQEKTKDEADEWNLENLGTLVWVRLDGKNTETAGVYTTRSKSKESLWWPASVRGVPISHIRLPTTYTRLLLHVRYAARDRNRRVFAKSNFLATTRGVLRLKSLVSIISGRGTASIRCALIRTKLRCRRVLTEERPTLVVVRLGRSRSLRTKASLLGTMPFGKCRRRSWILMTFPMRWRR